MATWMLNTNNDPLKFTRRLLQNIWNAAKLESMVVPVYQGGGKTARAMSINDPQRLVYADPFVPLMYENAGKLVAELAVQPSNAHRAAVLRACEIRALEELVKREHLNLENWLIIGVECVSCFPVQDFDWRVEKAGSVEKVTQEVLRNARQGGIAPYRFRSACQMCSRPEPVIFDICLELLGLPSKETMLVFTKDDAVDQKLELNKFTDGPASAELMAQHDRMVNIIEERRRHIREHNIRELFPHIPANLDDLTNLLMECQPCRKCIEACPVHPEEIIPAIDHGVISRETARNWLMSCAECGMCEQVCSKELPLSAIMSRISRTLKHELVTA